MNPSIVSFSLLSWNVRGLGDHDKCVLVRDAIFSARPCIVCIQETKLNAVDRLKVQSFLPAYLDEFQTLNADNTRGDSHCLELCSFLLYFRLHNPHSLTTTFSSTASNYIFAVTNVYAPAQHQDSLTFLNSLEVTATQVPE
ncbi:hypothetical protein SETIT_4G097500v2 [Setaria italica]|uniref:Endonuclease/exonuclease/phosphatase domain-containing protein n=1 Tax=Setaria italica TaxID=4555 RepID=A0A368QSJ6_SETIT|nr:hypothetical protein SETIT_4G097500v2 [Setaria italica]